MPMLIHPFIASAVTTLTTMIYLMQSGPFIDRPRPGLAYSVGVL